MTTLGIIALERAGRLGEHVRKERGVGLRTQ